MATCKPYNDNLEQQKESQITRNSFDSAPEIYGDNTFILDKDPNILLIAESLASEAKYLISILKTTQPSNILDQFQIELRKINPQDDQNSTYRMSLRIDPILWFTHHGLNSSNVQNLKKLYGIASHYVENVRSEIEHYPKTSNEQKMERIPIVSSVSKWCRAEQKGETCRRGEQHSCMDEHYQWCFDENQGETGACVTKMTIDQHNQKYLHTLTIVKNNKPAYQCRHRSTKLNRTQAFCLFHVDPNFWIYESKVTKPSCYPYFIVTARSDATPIITLIPVKHCGNEVYVQTGDAWQAVLQTLIYMKGQLKLDKLPLSRVYVNFGNWMQQKVDDPTCLDCHGHLNIVLSRQTIDKINDINRTKDTQRQCKKLFQSLVGSILPPKSHRLDDSLRLTKCMNDYMTPVLIEENRALARRVSILEIEVEKLKHPNEELTLRFYSIENGEETDETIFNTDANDIKTGINDKILPSESF